MTETTKSSPGLRGCFLLPLGGDQTGEKTEAETMNQQFQRSDGSEIAQFRAPEEDDDV